MTDRDEPVSGEGEKIGPPHVTAVEQARDAAQQFGDDDESNVEARLLSDVLHFLQAWTDPDPTTHADAWSEEPEPDAEDVRQMSDEELVEGLESLAISFCQEAGFGYMPVKLHALEIKRRLSDRSEDEGERDE